ncbi:tubulin binding cofactor A [Tuber indicum]|nr:tubulin binding cofactor A [Tuber indicum]
MPPPTSLSIKTSSVLRLIKEEASYLKETIQQKAAVEKLEQDGADEYELRQPRQVLEQTIVMAPAVRKQLLTALSSLSEALEAAPESESEENKKKAREALDNGKEVLEQRGVLE